MELAIGEYDFKYKDAGGQRQVFDIVRKKYVQFGPEEMVRQHLIHFLVEDKGISPSLISVEKELKVNELSKRTDIVLYDNEGKPYMIIECKAHNVKLDQTAFEQAARYNLSLKVPYLLISNGWEHYACSIDHETGSWKALETLPF